MLNTTTLRTIQWYILFCLFAAGCSQTTAWQATYLQGVEKKFNSTRLSYPIRDNVNGMAVHMVYSPSLGLKTHLEIVAQKIPPYQGDPSRAFVALCIGEATFQGVAYRHEGGQRTTLSSDSQEMLIQALCKGQAVNIQLQGYSAQVEPEGFVELYHKLDRPPFQNFLQLPFKL